MSGRNGNTVRVVGAVLSGVVIVYLFYANHSVQNKLRNSEGIAERYRVAQSSLSSQLKDVLSAKNEQESKFLNEKEAIVRKYNALAQERKLLMADKEDALSQLSKMKEDYEKRLKEMSEVNSKYEEAITKKSAMEQQIRKELEEALTNSDKCTSEKDTLQKENLNLREVIRRLKSEVGQSKSKDTEVKLGPAKEDLPRSGLDRKTRRKDDLDSYLARNNSNVLLPRKNSDVIDKNRNHIKEQIESAKLKFKSENRQISRGDKSENKLNVDGEKSENKLSVGGDKSENKLSIGGDKNENKLSAGGDKSENKLGFGGDKSENKLRVGGDRNENKLSFGGDKSEDKQISRGDKSENKLSPGGDKIDPNVNLMDKIRQIRRPLKPPSYQKQSEGEKHEVAVGAKDKFVREQHQNAQLAVPNHFIPKLRRDGDSNRLDNSRLRDNNIAQGVIAANQMKPPDSVAKVESRRQKPIFNEDEGNRMPQNPEM